MRMADDPYERMVAASRRAEALGDAQALRAKLSAKDDEITELIGKLNAANIQVDLLQRLLNEACSSSRSGQSSPSENRMASGSAVDRFRRDVARMSEDFIPSQIDAEIVGL